MRVIAGKYGGRPLKTLPGSTTRPTTDKVKGAIFNMLGGNFDGGVALDLYAGSGALAIEAVSRGCNSAVLVERDRKAQEIIVANLAMTKEPEKFQLLKMEAKPALQRLTTKFDLVFLDPPYAQEQIAKDIKQLLPLTNDNTKIICETDKAVTLPERIGPLNIWKQKTYGISKITIYSA